MSGDGSGVVYTYTARADGVCPLNFEEHFPTAEEAFANAKDYLAKNGLEALSWEQTGEGYRVFVEKWADISGIRSGSDILPDTPSDRSASPA